MAPVYFVTGGGSGLGRAACEALARVGASVACADRDLDAAKETVFLLKTEKKQEKFGSGAETLPVGKFVALGCDVTDPQAVREAVAQTVAELGSLWGVINCAGVGFAATTVTRENEAMDAAIFDQVLKINLQGTFYCAAEGAAAIVKSAEKIKAERKEGATGRELTPVIVNVASVAAFDGQKGQVAYSASKGGVVAMSLPMARDLARFGIRVVCIAPGIMETPMMAKSPDKVRSNLLGSVVSPKRFGSPQEFGELVVHLAQNEYLNGECIRLDGGIRMANL